MAPIWTKTAWIAIALTTSGARTAAVPTGSYDAAVRLDENIHHVFNPHGAVVVSRRDATNSSAGNDDSDAAPVTTTLPADDSVPTSPGYAYPAYYTQPAYTPGYVGYPYGQYGYQPQGYRPQAYQPHSYPQGQSQGYQGYQPQGYQPQGYQPQGYQPQGYPQGYQPQGYPQGYQPQGYQPPYQGGYQGNRQPGYQQYPYGYSGNSGSRRRGPFSNSNKAVAGQELYSQSSSPAMDGVRQAADAAQRIITQYDQEINSLDGHPGEDTMTTFMDGMSSEVDVLATTLQNVFDPSGNGMPTQFGADVLRPIVDMITNASETVASQTQRGYSSYQGGSNTNQNLVAYTNSLEALSDISRKYHVDTSQLDSVTQYLRSLTGQ